VTTVVTKTSQEQAEFFFDFVAGLQVLGVQGTPVRSPS
jgi:hypothetical protein